MSKWRVPDVWKNKTVYIFGGGPTLLASIEGYDFTGRCVLGVNSAFCLPQVDILYFGDAKFYWWNREAIQNFLGLKITSNQGVHHGNKTVEGESDIKLLPVGRHKGLETSPDRIGWNRSSGAAAINVSLHLGAKQIVLLGYDMRRVGGRKNWKRHEKENTNQNPYHYMLVGFAQIAREIKKFRCDIINATPGSAIDVFQKRKLKDLM